jgi:DNA-binding NarL/FixJ family response regulator
MGAKTKVLIFEKSYLIRQGLKSVLHNYNQFELADDFGDMMLFSSSIKMLNPGIIMINTELLSEIPMKEVKRMKKENEFILIGIGPGIENKSEIFDDIIEYQYDKQQIASALNYFIDIIKKEKGLKKTDNQLSDREKDIVVQIAKGLTNKEIANQLFLSVHTVITHRKNIGNKLGIKSASGLTVYAILNKLIDMKDLY